MQLQAKQLLTRLETELKEKRRAVKHRPTLAVVWIKTDTEADQASQIFLNKKRELAEQLDCEFRLMELEASTPQQQAEALINRLVSDRQVDGIVLQLPIPARLNREKLISLIAPAKDIDGLNPHSPWPAPNPHAIVSLLEANKIEPKKEKVMILGDGILVGRPLAVAFKKAGVSFEQINQQAEEQTNQIKRSTLLIGATGVKNLISPGMVNEQMIVVDGSGLDVEVEKIEPLVKAITPSRGAIGPLTVHYLLDNLLSATRAQNP